MRTATSVVAACVAFIAIVVEPACHRETKRAMGETNREPLREPATGFFELPNEAGAPSWYESVQQYKPLLAGYPERRCELVMGDNGEKLDPVRAVFLVRRPSGTFQVVSRKGLDVYSSTIATTVADVSVPTAQILSKACADVLARHDPFEGWGKDGRTFYASHWTPEGTLRGRRWSPAVGTVARGFVDLELKLQKFAAAKPDQRGALERELVTAAQGLSEWVAPSQ